MQQYFFDIPFANAGDKATIPITVQSDGSISYPSGYGAPYAEDLQTNPSALAIDRETFNQLMFAITQNIQNYQQYGFPEWIDSTDNGGTAFPYDVGAVVRYSATGTAPFTTYVSLVTANTETPTGTNWSEFVNLSNFKQGSNADGYWRQSPDGFLEQWGTVSNAGTGARQVAIIMPQPFANLNYDVSATDVGADCFTYSAVAGGQHFFNWFIPQAYIGTSATPITSADAICNWRAKGWAVGYPL